MAEALPLRIFLASPSDLEAERDAVRKCVQEHKASREDVSHVTYQVVEWDRVRGTARRAQEAIDELIAESHFMVVLFKGAWGNEPGSPWGYTSGTEEELFTGLLELGQAEQPMRDIWVAFIEDAAPAPQILELRQQMIERHSLMFESIANLHDLRQKLADRLRSWEAIAGHKIPRHIDLMPSSGRDVLRAANLRIRGEKLVELGLPDAGRTALEEAAALGGPIELLAYARFLRRQGDLDGAYASTEKAIGYFVEGGPLYSPAAADAFSALARVLSAQGRHNDAIGRLEHALTLLVVHDPYARAVRCRILDDLGLAYRKTGDLASARRQFEVALQLRRESGEGSEVCQSLVNLARLEVAEGDLETAARYAGGVVDTLRGTPPSALHANAETLVAQIRLRQGRGEEGIPFADRALTWNRQIGNWHGEAIALHVLAQCCRAAGRSAEAREHARASVEVNRSLGDRYGEAQAQWFLDHLPD